MCEYASGLAFFFLHLSLQCTLWNKVFLVWKLYWSCSAFEIIICCTRFLSAKCGHNDYIILTFKAQCFCPNCLLQHSLCPLLQTSTPDLTPVFIPYSTHLDQNHFLMMEIVAWNIPLSNGKTENSLLGVWFWGSVSRFWSQPFVTGSYIYVRGIFVSCFLKLITNSN